MRLTEANLEKCNHLFMPSCSLLIAEHELNGGKWDVEVDLYDAIGYDPKRGLESITGWEYVESWGVFDSVADLISQHPWFANYMVIPGDDINLV